MKWLHRGQIAWCSKMLDFTTRVDIPNLILDTITCAKAMLSQTYRPTFCPASAMSVTISSFTFPLPPVPILQGLCLLAGLWLLPEQVIQRSGWCSTQPIISQFGSNSNAAVCINTLGKVCVCLLPGDNTPGCGCIDRHSTRNW